MERDFNINITARRRFAELARRLCARRLTNDEFEDAFEYGDTAVTECYVCYFWQMYSDLREHTVELTKEEKRDAARVLLFLYTDQEYVWPRSSCVGALVNLCTLGLFNSLRKRSLANTYEQQGLDESVWPFANRQSFALALTNPPLLCGAA